MSNFGSIPGYPLKQTSPAAVEKALVERVRNDLGSFSDLALIKPILKIDSEDSDLSGNLTNAYGTIVVKVINKGFHIPFIIHNKELLPFDVIRMGNDEVSYDMAKLRKLVVELDRLQKEQGGDLDEGAMGSIVSIKEVPTHNGFLGSIMQVRDDFNARDATGQPLYTGDNFGVIDDGRLFKMAKDLDELFEEFHEKFAEVQVISEELVKKQASEIEATFEKKASIDIRTVTGTNENSLTAAQISRLYDKVQEDKLVDVSRVASGNNVTFPIHTPTSMEYRNGRAYSTIVSLVSQPLKTDFKRLVIDSAGNYVYLKSNEKFAVANRQPNQFKMSVQTGSSLETEGTYTLEDGTDKIYAPFVVKRKFKDGENNLRYVSNTTFKTLELNQSRMMREILYCEQTLPITNPKNIYGIDSFVIIVLRDSHDGFKLSSRQGILDKISEVEESADGIRIANYALDCMYSSFPGNDPEQRIYTVGEYAQVFIPIKNKIKGFFTRPDGLFTEGPLFDKQAAYGGHNKARVIVEQNTRPQTYTVEWQFIGGDADEENSSLDLEVRKEKNLAPDQVKKILTELGYDERQKELFFQITSRNGRMAEFNLPSIELAKNVAPVDKGRSKAAEFVKGLVDTSLNASNFMPAFKNSLTATTSEVLTPVLESTSSNPKAQLIRGAVNDFLGKEANESLVIAQEMEKVAESLRSPAWFSVAQLMNMKHHLDKLAFEATKGFVKESQEVWSITSELEPHIAKVAKDLILFNREQMLKSAHDIVPSGLVKETITHLDKLASYGQVAKNLKDKFNFFKQPDHIGPTLKQLNEQAKNLKQTFSQERRDLAKNVAKRRAYENMNTPEANAVVGELTNKIMESEENLQELVNSLSSVNAAKGALNEELKSFNRKRVIGTAVPVSALTGFGFAALGTE